MISEVKRSAPVDHLSPNLSLGLPAGDLGRALAAAAAALNAIASALNQGGACRDPIRALSCSLTLGELAREFLLAKARAGKSDRYLRALRNSLGKFVAGRHGTGVEQITHADLEKWLHAGEWGPRTRLGYLNDVSTLFNFAVRRGYLARNPAAGVERPQLNPAAYCLHTPAQVAAVLATAAAVDRDVCRKLAVRYFAGVRSAECERLREADLAGDHLEVSARNSKTRARRLVPITPALRAWLALGGELRPIRADRITAVIRRAGVPWPHNVTRHTFVSYHLAAGNNAAATALIAGHSEAVLFRVYRELATPAQAAAFWALRPQK